MPVISLLQVYSPWDPLKNPRHTNTLCHKGGETLLSLVEVSDHISFLFKIPARLSPLLSGVTQREEYI